MSETASRTRIPWCSEKEWNQVYLSIKRIHDLYGTQLDPVVALAATIRKNYEAISGAIEKLCAHTCVSCEDICCVRATIWFDFKDLLYLYFGLNKHIKPVFSMI